jgi:hypothetical protein
MGSVTVYIRGLAIYYYRGSNKLWNVVFPVDTSEHRVRFIHSSGATPPKPVYLAKKRIRVSGGMPGSSSHIGTGFKNKALNYSSREFHNGQVDWRNPKGDFTWMTVENASLFAAELRQRRIGIISGSQRPKTRVRQITSMIGMRIDVNPLKTLKMAIEGETDIAVKAGDTLWFDNECRDVSSVNDSVYYSQMLYNPRNPSANFEIASHPLDDDSILPAQANVLGILGGPPPAFCDGIWLDPEPPTEP